MSQSRQPPQQQPAQPAPDWSVGWRPDRGPNGQPAGPYAHMSTMDSGSFQTGFGLFKNQWSNGASLDVMNADLETGLMGAPGQRRIGTKASAQMFNGKTPDNFPIGAEMQIFNAGAESTIGEDGASFGLGAGVISGAARFGQNTADRNNDRQFRIGGGLGVGGAGRLHWSDTDGDGQREYGFGADIGPVSFDYKSEDPVADLLTLPFGGPGVMLGLEEMGVLPKDFNLTNAVGSGLSAAGSAIADGASWAGNKIADGASAAWDAVTSW